MFVAASTRCFSDKSFSDACGAITDLEFDKIEIWLCEESDHLRPSEVAADPERTVARFRESSRLSVAALYLEHDVSDEVFAGLTQFAQLLKIAQITIPAAPLGAPFNTEIDRLRELSEAATRDGLRLSLKTQAERLTEDPHTAVELCQAVPGLGITLDPSYYICNRSGQAASYDVVYSHVYHVHLRDTSPERVQVPVGLGQIDYSRMISQLRQVGYNRALSVDLIPSESGDSEERMLEMRKLRLLLESLL